MKNFIQYLMFVPFSVGIILSELILIPFMVFRNYTPIYYDEQFVFYTKILLKHSEMNPFIHQNIYKKAIKYFPIIWLFTSFIHPFYRFFINLKERAELFFEPEFIE